MTTLRTIAATIALAGLVAVLGALLWPSAPTVAVLPIGTRAPAGVRFAPR